MRNIIIDYVKNQISVNLEEFRTDFTKRWERENEIIIEWREVPKTQQRKIELLAANKHTKIRIEKVGVWGMMIAYVGEAAIRAEKKRRSEKWHRQQ